MILLVSLCACLGPRLCGTRASYAILVEGDLGLIERWPRKAKRRGRFGNRTAFFLDTTQHLVLDLNHIPRIEELAGSEKLVGHVFRAWVECSRTA